MGAYWLTDLPAVIAAAGLDVDTWPGWETRSRSSGGYDQVLAVFAHHTASSTTLENDCGYMWADDNPDAPVGALYLARTGLVVVGAAGATNCQGKGGPVSLSRGTIPLDKGNAYGIAIEAANSGTGEPWPAEQVDAYVTLCNALCNAYGLDPSRDVLAHFEWCAPSCPGRKIDPAGPSPYASGSSSWDMDAFRADVDAPEPDPNPPAPNPPAPAPEEPDMLYMGRLDTNPNLVLIGNGVTAVRVRSESWPWIESQMAAGLSKWHHPQRSGYPLIDDADDIATFTAGQLRAAVGVELDESAT